MTPIGDVYEKTGASTWALRANIAGPPGPSAGLEIVNYYAGGSNTTGTGVTATGNGDALFTFPAATYRAVPHYFEMTIHPNSNAGNQSLVFRLHDGTAPGPLIGQELATVVPAVNPGNPVTLRLQFTPTAGAHTFQVRWRAPAAGTYFLAQASTPTVARIVEDAIGSIPLISPPLIQGPTTLPTADYPGQRMTYWLASNAIYRNPAVAVHWDFVWNPTAWWFVGGTPLAYHTATSDVTGWTASAWNAHPACKVTVPEKGIYVCSAHADVYYGTSAINCSMRVTGNSGGVAGSSQADVNTFAANMFSGMEIVEDPIQNQVLNKGQEVRLEIFPGAAGVAIRRASLSVRPLYITN